MNFSQSNSNHYTSLPLGRGRAAGMRSLYLSSQPFLASKKQKPKSQWQLARISLIAFGLEYCDAAETALVTPILLKLGIPVLYMTFVWCLSPVLGLTLGPVLGALSDKSRSRFGRRKPFILTFSLGIITGLVLLLLPFRHGVHLTEAVSQNYTTLEGNTSTQAIILEGTTDMSTGGQGPIFIAIFLTVVGVAVLDFCINICQSPSRAFLLEVVNPNDHQRGLSTLTLMAGIGGSIGFIIGGINWGKSPFIKSLGGHKDVVFTLALLVYVFCVALTVTSEKDVPLPQLEETEVEELARKDHPKDLHYTDKSNNYGSVSSENEWDRMVDGDVEQSIDEEVPPGNLSFRAYLISVVSMPSTLLILCLTHMFCWMSVLSYTLFFTDFVGQAVFNGNPKAPTGSQDLELYSDGVRFGSFCLSLHLISCAGYSVIIQHLVQKWGAKCTYIGSQLAYSLSALLLAITAREIPAIIASIAAGIMYAALFNVPFILLAQYSEAQLVMVVGSETKQSRGLGSDISILISIVFVAQLIVSFIMGPLMHVTGSTHTVMICAAVFSACGALSATQVTYLDF